MIFPLRKNGCKTDPGWLQLEEPLQMQILRDPNNDSNMQLCN